MLLQACLPLVVRYGLRLKASIQGSLEREPGRISSHALQTFQNAGSIGSAATGLASEHLAMQHVEVGASEQNFWTFIIQIQSNYQQDRWGFSIICLVVLALGAFYIGIQAMAILTAGIVSSSFGVPTSSGCGFWLPVDPVSDDGYSFGPTNTEEMYESIHYAEARYGGALLGMPGFETVRQRIDYQVFHNGSCPFTVQCCLSNRSAITFDTGKQSAQVLGINTMEEYSFRRQLRCAPLISPNLNNFSSRETQNDVIENHYKARPGDSYRSMQVLDRESCYDFRYCTKFGISSGKQKYCLI